MKSAANIPLQISKIFQMVIHLSSSVGIIPGEPSDVVVTEATKSYVVLAWKPPVQRGHEGVMYYIEKVDDCL